MSKSLEKFTDKELWIEILKRNGSQILDEDFTDKATTEDSISFWIQGSSYDLYFDDNGKLTEVYID